MILIGYDKNYFLLVIFIFIQDNDDEKYHTKSSNDTKPELYYAHSDFIDDIGDCGSFQRGDMIEIHEKHPSGWWSGRGIKNGSVLTWISASFLQKVFENCFILV